MITIPVDDLESGQNPQKIKDHLKSDGLIIYPTDTLYGIGCDFYSISAQQKIDKIKKREDLPYSIAISDPEMIAELASPSLQQFESFIERTTPAKMTFLFKLRNNIDKRLVKGSELIGIRIPDYPAINKLISYLGFPLITTSINITGEQPLNSPEKIRSMLGREKISSEIILIDAGVLPESKGSTIIDFCGKDIKIIRKGDEYLRAKRFISDL